MKTYLHGSKPPETAWHTPARQLEEAWFLGLRLNTGVSISALQREFGEPAVAPTLEAAARMESAGLLETNGDIVRLTTQGRLLSNNVFQEFLELADEKDQTEIQTSA